jgi:hypothetical protein
MPLHGAIRMNRYKLSSSSALRRDNHNDPREEGRRYPFPNKVRGFVFGWISRVFVTRSVRNSGECAGRDDSAFAIRNEVCRISVGQRHILGSLELGEDVNANIRHAWKIMRKIDKTIGHSPPLHRQYRGPGRHGVARRFERRLARSHPAPRILPRTLRIVVGPAEHNGAFIVGRRARSGCQSGRSRSRSRPRRARPSPAESPGFRPARAGDRRRSQSGRTADRC